MITRVNYFEIMSYLDYQEKVLLRSNKTIDRKWAHLRHLLNWADEIPFPEVSRLDDPSFSTFLLTDRNDGATEPLSPASMQRACLEARNFFLWAKEHKRSQYRKISVSWIDTLRPPRARGIQSMLVEREYYSLAEVRALLDFKPIRLIDARDQAAVAFLFLSGMRISAFVTLPLQCVDAVEGVVEQLPSKGVRTKNSKAARTYLLPIADLHSIVEDWHHRVENELAEDALWYPNLSADGNNWNISQEYGDSESRRLSFSRGLKRLCARAGIPYKSPHKLRNGHGVYGMKTVKTIEELKAFSQNMMHENMEITDRLYGKLSGKDVGSVIVNLKEKGSAMQTTDDPLFREFLAFREWLDKRRD